ncbi:uncharacterized protein LY89DRAFT_355562 [Mollisia scopiformis]|uniref:Uncharacterized protein n=1 Tax=Mollisia scopiformis TaxID=149040 RepID=A0A132B529_MOLSC|nr:uncharacterized protein LY89DRAFT_355562 [Mollisia scopiformis]KUJ07512.1 hypothetical protein LY89DRAFT_355562 [Mollisia scopiformis]
MPPAYRYQAIAVVITCIRPITPLRLMQLVNSRPRRRQRCSFWTSCRRLLSTTVRKPSNLPLPQRRMYRPLPYIVSRCLRSIDVPCLVYGTWEHLLALVSSRDLGTSNDMLLLHKWIDMVRRASKMSMSDGWSHIS